MQSRRDQVQAYFFVVGRLVAAVVHGRPDALQQPNKRMNTGTVMGVVLAAVLMGVFGVYGIFVPGGDDSWRRPGAIVMNADSGARYVFLDGQLRPVLNYSSARIAAGQNGGTVVKVSQASLSGAPVGQPIGIPGAPDTLPATGALNAGPWTVCLRPAAGGAQPSTPSTTLVIGAPVQLVSLDAQALLVRSPDGSVFLVWQGKRYRIPGRAEQAALGYGDHDPMAVTAAWLNPVPQAADLVAHRSADLGQPGPVIGGTATVAGRVYRVRNQAIGTDQLYLMHTSGLTPLSRTSAALVLGASFTKQAYGAAPVTPIELGADALAHVPSAPDGLDLPAVPPQVATIGPDVAPCLAFVPQGDGGVQAISGLMPASVHAVAMPVAAHPAGTTADRVSIPAGGGVLAGEVSAPGGMVGAVYLVTETGMKYPVADAGVLAALGYSEQSVQAVPGGLLALLPSGPVLSTPAALSTASKV